MLSKRYNRTCLILNWIEAARGAQMRKLWEGLEVWRDSAVNEKAERLFGSSHRMENISRLKDGNQSDR